MSLTENQKAIRRQYGRIRALHKQRNELHKQLTLSLIIQEIWPEAFDCGGCSSRLVDKDGKPNMTERHSQLAYRRGELFVRIIRKDGKFVEVNAQEVSETLLAQHGFFPMKPNVYLGQ